jgi:hypothetical protein
MTARAPKPIVTSWDVFDTLVARFDPDPLAVFHTVAQLRNTPDFVQRRLDAQAALDRIGQPYVVHDIYRQMVTDGLTTDHARDLLGQEIAVERQQMIPIRRNVVRVVPTDLIISDMYLSPEIISAFLFEVCDLHVHRPIVRSNWGKHTGTIWPLVLNEYIIRRHVGDSQHSDVDVPTQFRIACELTQDSKFTSWEQRLQELGFPQLARVQRELRLRRVTGVPTAFHEAVVGPYATLLVCLAIALLGYYGQDAEFAFLSRGADELARVFIALFPAIQARTIDMSRRLINGGEQDGLFAAAITRETVVVDLVSSGRSFFRFAERNGKPGRVFVACVFLNTLLNQDEHQRAEELVDAGRFRALFSTTGDGLHFRPLEHLSQSPYPPVAGLAVDAKSGGMVRRFGGGDLDADEAGLIAWKSGVVTELVRTMLRRGLSSPPEQVVMNILNAALENIFAHPDIMAPFTSFNARETMDET